MNVLTCAGCGNPLECFEGEVYCPDCTWFGLLEHEALHGVEPAPVPPEQGHRR
jgi:hypothetical protein